MMRCRRLLFVALVLAMLCLAQNIAGDDAHPEAEPSKPNVRLLDTGAEPRLGLRYAPQVGDVHDFRVIYQSTHKQVVEGREKPAPLSPILNFVLRLTVKAIDPAEDVITFDCECVEARVEPGPGVPADLATKASATLEPMIGWYAKLRTNARGNTTLVYDQLERFSLLSMELSRGAIKSIGLLFPNLPEEAIGRGGRWVSVTESEGGDGLAFRQDVTYTVRELTPAQATIDISLVQHGESQEQKMGGTRFKVNDFAGDGKGEATIDLGLGVVRSFTLTQTQITDMVVADVGIPVHDTLTKSFTIERLDRPAETQEE